MYPGESWKFTAPLLHYQGLLALQKLFHMHHGLPNWGTMRVAIWSEILSRSKGCHDINNRVPDYFKRPAQVEASHWLKLSALLCPGGAQNKGESSSYGIPHPFSVQPCPSEPVHWVWEFGLLTWQPPLLAGSFPSLHYRLTCSLLEARLMRCISDYCSTLYIKGTCVVVGYKRKMWTWSRRTVCVTSLPDLLFQPGWIRSAGSLNEVPTCRPNALQGHAFLGLPDKCGKLNVHNCRLTRAWREFLPSHQ